MAQANSASDAPAITAWWGKLGAGGGSRGYHPLICHMLDVAAVAEAIWDEVLRPPARSHIRIGLGLDEESAARTWVAFLAGLHDTGKCSPSFALRPGAEQLAHLYADCRPNPGRGDPKAAPHGEVTALALPKVLMGRFGMSRRVAGTLATAIGGHHGTFPTDIKLQSLEDKVDAVGEGGWKSAREELVIRLAELLHVEGVAVPVQADRAVSLTIAGLVSVSDWIGSIEELFPYLVTDLSAVPIVGEGYLARTRAQALKALNKLHWTGWKPEATRPSFAEMFEGKSPRPLQDEIIALSERLEGPGLIVIEAPMGEGKTEAALYLADRWGLEPGASGLYLALPTQATSNQMFGRLKRFLEQRYPTGVVNLQLLHGLADLQADFEELKQREAYVPRLTPDDESEEQAGVIAATWFAQRKRGLLAPFGVGTVDQVLMAVLRTKHVFVRLYGLAGRVVVIDEVHAYDTYMTKLIERLLEWLGALGSPVILLSATLPRARRDALLHAYSRGLHGRDNEAPEPPQAPYPRITWVLKGVDGQPDTDARGFSPAQPGRTLLLHWQDGRLPDDPDAPFPLRRRLKGALANGGCAAIICNTVNRAQKIYSALARDPDFQGQASDGGPLLDLFHARFPQHMRAEREQRTLARFGPDAKRRPQRAVLVATQVIEQSLDLDFDLMVTDFAPADLMLQRAGRLWRHDRQRPEGIDAATLWICAPALGEDSLPIFPVADEFIYDEHVLFRTWLAMKDHRAVAIPGDIEPLIEAVYDDSPPPDGVSEPVLQRWEQTFRSLGACPIFSGGWGDSRPRQGCDRLRGA